MRTRWLILLFATGFLCSCKTVPKNNQKITLNGMVYDSENKPAVNYQIYLNGKCVATSDIGGRFSIDDIKIGSYKFLGKGDGYLDIEENIEVYDKNQILYLRVPSIESKFQEAYSYLIEQKLSQAELCIMEILENNNKNSTALYFMGIIEYLKNNTEESRKYIEKIKILGGESLYVSEFEKILNKY